jgi:hypothetical protein
MRFSSIFGCFFALFCLATCTKDNPQTCTSLTECGEGQRCDLATFNCVGTNADASADTLLTDAPIGSGGVGGLGGTGGAPPTGCTAQGGCTGALAVCDVASGLCVECATDVQCPVGRPACVAGACTGCQNSGQCAGRTGTVCNVATGLCVACSAAADCTAPGKSFCVANECVACQASSDCKDANAPICIAGVCAKCAGDAQCATKDAALPRCDTTAGKCVECLQSSQCAVAANPICSAGSCGACTTDAACAAKLGPNPGICLAHEGGRCELDAETIYVRNSPGICTNSVAEGGTAAKPFCRTQMAVDAVTAGKRVVVLRGPDALLNSDVALSGSRVSMIGQLQAEIAPGALGSGIHLQSGELFVRNITVRNSEKPGIIAEAGSTLRLEGVTLKNNTKGGLLINGANFAIKACTLQGNGPGSDGPISWGGILIKSPPTTGPASIEATSVVGNDPIGVSCTGMVSATGALVTGNLSSVQITPSCGFTSCTTGAAGCGAP